MIRVFLKKVEKTIIKIVVISLCVLLSVSIIIGIIGFFAKQDKTKGTFFRKMYGSVGIANNEEYTMKMILFSFGEKVDFLNDWKNISFDNDAVNITNLSYEVQDKENDLTIYAVFVSIKMRQQGRYVVKSLNYDVKNDEGDSNCDNKTFPLGEIYFIYEGGDDDFLLHGCNTNIVNGEAVFTFSADNPKPFRITDIIVEGDNIKYKYNKNVQFEPGNDLIYKIIVDSNISQYDLNVLQPIFVIEYEGDKEKKYFSPYMIVFSGVDMTYDEIKEYVK